MAYLYGTGDTFIGEKVTGGGFGPGKVYHTPEFEVEVEDERLQHKNTSGPKRQLDLDISLETMPKIRIVIDEFDGDILAIGAGGERTEVTSGDSFTNEVFPTVAADDVIPVPGGWSNLESLTITDSAGTPATLTAGTHYTVDLAKGLVTFITVSGKTQPFKAAGSENDGFDVISIGTDPLVEKFVRFSGVNIADEDQGIFTVELYRASFKPTKIPTKQTGTEVAQWEFEVAVLADPNAPFDEDFGQYGRIIKG